MIYDFLRSEDTDSEMIMRVAADGMEDGWVRELLLAHAGDSPKELAARLVTEAKGRGHDDDRTALVMRIEKR